MSANRFNVGRFALQLFIVAAVIVQAVGCVTMNYYLEARAPLSQPQAAYCVAGINGSVSR